MGYFHSWDIPTDGMPHPHRGESRAGYTIHPTSHFYLENARKPANGITKVVIYGSIGGGNMTAGIGWPVNPASSLLAASFKHSIVSARSMLDRNITPCRSRRV